MQRVVASCAAAMAQTTNSCTDLVNLKIEGVDITKAAIVQAEATVLPPYPGAPGIACWHAELKRESHGKLELARRVDRGPD